jgi:hypothetical protein
MLVEFKKLVMAHKICTKCKQDKELSEFNKCSRVKDGCKAVCRECQKKESDIYHETHKEEAHQYYLDNIEKITEQNKTWSMAHPDKVDKAKKDYVKNHPEERREQSKRSYHKNKHTRKIYIDKNRIESNRKKMEYRQTHPQERISHNLRTRIGAVLSGRSKGGRLYLLVGCDMDFLKGYLESFWTEGMDWDNYGRGIGKWSLDHTIPLETFDLTNEEEQKKAFYYTNMRPMWYPENASKGSLHNGKRYSKKSK